MIIEQMHAIQAESLPTDSARFSIDPTQVAHIMGILRSSLYTKRALAVIREYCSNAWDAHRSVGKGGVPIVVHIPTTFEPVFTVRDFGPGLSREDVLERVTQYGYSSKRASNDEVGCLGIGFKAGFCLTDQFTVTSWHGGVKAIYTAALEASNMGVMSLFHEEPCGDETGLEISVPVQARLVDEFQAEAERFFPTMIPSPICNVPFQARQLEEDGSWYHLHPNSGEQRWTGVMGCIPYRIDLSHPALKECLIGSVRGSLDAGISLPLGSVDFSANREELQYTQRTIDTVRQCILGVQDAYMARLMAALEDDNVPGWQRRLSHYKAVAILGMKIGDAVDVMPKLGIPATAQYTSVHALRVFPHVRIYLHPGLEVDARSLHGWDLPDGCPLVVPRLGITKEAAQSALEANLKGLGLDGIPLVELDVSTRRWFAPKGASASNLKHKRDIFTLTSMDQSLYGSERWSIASEIPSEEHVYVLLRSFKSDPDALDTQGHWIKTCVQSLGGVWPTIYGYKVTSKKSWAPGDIPNGIPFKDWVVDTLRTLVGGNLDFLCWANAHEAFSNQELEIWAKALPEDHLISQGFRKIQEAHNRLVTWREDQVQGLRLLRRYRLLETGNPYLEWMDTLQKQYPLLRLHLQNAPYTRGSQAREILQYLKERDFFLLHHPTPTP